MVWLGSEKERTLTRWIHRRLPRGGKYHHQQEEEEGEGEEEKVKPHVDGRGGQA